MKSGIHPTYYPNARVVCACGNAWLTGSTTQELTVSVCSQCHPFYTGEQRIVDTVGRVDRFMRRLEARQSQAARAEIEAKARREAEDAARKARARGDDPDKAAADVMARYEEEIAAAGD